MNKLKFIRKVFATITIILFLMAFLNVFGFFPKQYWHQISSLQFIPSIIRFIEFGLPIGIGFILVIILTFLMGRIYCSIICPLGISFDIVRRIFNTKSDIKKNKKNVYKEPMTKTRYIFLILPLALSVLLSSVSFLGLLDPYSIFGRTMSLIFYPIAKLLNNVLYIICSQFDVYVFISQRYVPFMLIPFLWAFIYFIMMIFMAGKYGRLYCNSICPVGTLLGIFSRFSIFKIRLDKSTCVNCKLCQRVCKSSCIDLENGKIDSSRCVMCFDCLDVCKKGSIKLSAFKPKLKSLDNKQSDNVEKQSFTNTQNNETENSSKNQTIERRNFIKAAVLLPVAMKTASGQNKLEDDLTIAAKFSKPQNGKAVQLQEQKRKRLGQNEDKQNHIDFKKLKENEKISPEDLKRYMPSAIVPGAVSINRYLENCTSCQLCVKTCKNNILKPSFTSLGLEGFMVPVMDFTNSYCEFDCVDCTTICPNRAIKPLTLEEKHSTKIGEVKLYLSRCVTFARTKECGACQEICPTQAVFMVEKDGKPTMPKIKQELCIGCGACENACPEHPKAIKVMPLKVHTVAKKESSAGENKVAPLQDFPF